MSQAVHSRNAFEPQGRPCGMTAVRRQAGIEGQVKEGSRARLPCAFLVSRLLRPPIRSASNIGTVASGDLGSATARAANAFAELFASPHMALTSSVGARTSASLAPSCDDSSKKVIAAQLPVPGSRQMLDDLKNLSARHQIVKPQVVIGITLLASTRGFPCRSRFRRFLSIGTICCCKCVVRPGQNTWANVSLQENQASGAWQAASVQEHLSYFQHDTATHHPQTNVTNP